MGTYGPLLELRSSPKAVYGKHKLADDIEKQKGSRFSPRDSKDFSGIFFSTIGKEKLRMSLWGVS
jgi:hypothetical protein